MPVNFHNAHTHTIEGSVSKQTPVYSLTLPPPANVISSSVACIINFLGNVKSRRMCRSESGSESTVANNIFRIAHCFLCLTALILCRGTNIGSVVTYRNPRSRDVPQTRT